MTSHGEPESAPSSLRMLQIIVGALVMGVVSFVVIAIVVAPSTSSTMPPSTLHLTGVVMLLTCVPLASIR